MRRDPWVELSYVRNSDRKVMFTIRFHVADLLALLAFLWALSLVWPRP